MKFKKSDLLAKSYEEYPIEEYPYAVRDWEMIEGFVGDEDQGSDGHGGIETIVVFERDGQRWGFTDWWHDEVGTGFEHDYGDDDEIECFPVKEVAVLKMVLDRDAG